MGNYDSCLRSGLGMMKQASKGKWEWREPAEGSHISNKQQVTKSPSIHSHG